jgi:hypothetical protein
MQNTNGEHILDALLSLGYHVEIADDGNITASRGTQTLVGKAAGGAIEWSDKAQIYRVLELAYIAKLRKRVSEATST